MNTNRQRRLRRALDCLLLGLVVAGPAGAEPEPEAAAAATEPIITSQPATAAVPAVPAVSAPLPASSPTVARLSAIPLRWDRPTAMPPTPASGVGASWVTLPAEALEGNAVTLRWRGSPEVVKVNLTATCERTRLGGRSRGYQTWEIATGAAGARGEATWTVPWADGIALRFNLAAVDSDGRVLGVTQARVPYRPKVLANRRQDGIDVWLTSPHGQRLYLQRGGRLVWSAICSGAAGARVAPPGVNPSYIHDHHGDFSVLRKAVEVRSNLNRAWRMPFSMFYFGGHAIHATSSDQYSKLGRPASHGCVRLHLDDAKHLYYQVAVGCRVSLF